VDLAMGQGDSRSIPIAGRKIQRVKALAEGAYGFVDLAVDKHDKSKVFALKRILAQDAETNALALNEIAVMVRIAIWALDIFCGAVALIP
jgi:hypothetical protein